MMIPDEIPKQENDERFMRERDAAIARAEKAEAALALYERDGDADLLVWTIKGPTKAARDAKGGQ